MGTNECPALRLEGRQCLMTSNGRKPPPQTSPPAITNQRPNNSNVFINHLLAQVLQPVCCMCLFGGGGRWMPPLDSYPSYIPYTVGLGLELGVRLVKLGLARISVVSVPTKIVNKMTFEFDAVIHLDPI